MEGFKPPEGLRLSGNLAQNWKKFRQQLDLFLEATEPEKPRSAKQKAAILLHIAGPDALEVYNTFQCTDAERGNYNLLLEKFETYCTPRCNETYERYVFRSRMQKEGEPFESYFRDLQLKVQSCNFDTLADSMTRDQIVYGTADKKLRERMLREESLTLEKAVQFCKTAELTETHKKAWEAPDHLLEPVSALQKEVEAQKCSRCNRQHEPRRCPAYGQVCSKCKKKNHWAACCRSRVYGHDDRRVTDGVTCEHDDFAVLEVQAVTGDKADWLVEASVANQKVLLKVDPEHR